MTKWQNEPCSEHHSSTATSYRGEKPNPEHLALLCPSVEKGTHKQTSQETYISKLFSLGHRNEELGRVAVITSSTHSNPKCIVLILNRKISRSALFPYRTLMIFFFFCMFSLYNLMKILPICCFQCISLLHIWHTCNSRKHSMCEGSACTSSRQQKIVLLSKKICYWVWWEWTGFMPDRNSALKWWRCIYFRRWFTVHFALPIMVGDRWIT